MFMKNWKGSQQIFPCHVPTITLMTTVMCCLVRVADFQNSDTLQMTEPQM